MPGTSTTIARSRERGVHYTPSFITRFMLHACLTGPLADRLDDDDDPLRIVDPACGDGAFVLEAFDELERRLSDVSPTDLIRRHLYGVDIDREAVAQLRRRLRERVPDDCEPSRLISVMRESFRSGDALCGDDFDRSQRSSGNGLDWHGAFPNVARAGGFDLVIGNPPYVREKDAKAMFDRLRETELGRRYGQPRMDLWHYFLHRGLDLLRPGGVLCFIVNSYWTSAVSARPLIERLAAETTVLQLDLLGDSPLFQGVSGRHMILQVQKGRSERDCQILDLSCCDDVQAMLSHLSERGQLDDGWAGPSASLLTLPPQTTLGHQIIESRRRQESLFDRGRLQVVDSSATEQGNSGTRLGDVFDVRQGIAENPPFVTRKMATESNDQLDVGSGVFVLTADEVERLELSEAERSLIRPYYATRSLGRYELPEEPTHWLLYLTPQTSPDIDVRPHIAQHLRPVRPFLERRREVGRGTIAWWHLHWPRRERLFNAPRILAVQMGRRPRFVYAETPTYVGFSTNIVQSTDASSVSLPALTAILNSHWAEDWFRANAKWRGVALDISGTVLRDFPIPDLNERTLDRLEELCLRRQSTLPAEHQRIEDEIELLIPGMTRA
ncbi:MAG: Eco57I restriction-modification methylase domain-containing protein [Planctomycetaceae bacterium]|nr:Eco57I restriction-modification methylase domain-containing protein [Planctomycetaceae bacterium]